MSSGWRQPGAPNRGRGAWRSRGRPSPRGSSPQAHRDVQPERKMEHIASISRSSGLEKDGDTLQRYRLKDFRVQEEYRAFLQGKVNDVLSRYSRRASESESEARQRIDAQENLLILFRKLREGVSSSRRRDAFVLEVYETSLYLTSIFDASRQTTSVIPHLLPELYLSSPPPHPNCTTTILVSLAHYLVAGYPSQLSFRQHLNAIPSSMFPRTSEALKWINSLSRSLRMRNYIKFEELTGRSAISRLFSDSGMDTDTLSSALASLSIVMEDNNNALSRQALEVLIDNLRKKARATTWDVIRSAYREMSFATTAEGNGTRDWLTCSLCLRPLMPYEVELDLEMWLEQQNLLGNVRRKEGVGGQWIICKR